MKRFTMLLKVAALVLITCGTAFAQTPQTITFAALANKTYGNAPFAVSATASSGLAVVFSSTTTGVCTVAGSTVTLVAAGGCTIAANQPGDGTYAPAQEVQRSFTVNKAGQTLSFASISAKTLANSPLPLTATASSGLTVAFSGSTPAVCTVSGATATLVATGSCTVTASQPGDANYNAATSVPRTFTVNKVAQSITFATISTKTLAQSPLALTGTASSGLTVDFSSTTPAVCAVAGTAATLLTTGTCSIAANQAGDSYWAAAPQILRSFSVTKASQTISFATLSNRTYSPTPFGITGTATSGLSVAFATTTPTICTVATDGGGATTVTMLIAGTCTVTANQAGDATYNAATQVSRSFTISKASQTLAIDTIATKNIGDADFQPWVTNSAGLPYILSTTTTGVCTVANNGVTLVATGTCTVLANAPSTPAYNAATQQSRSFTVAAARAPIVYYVHPDQIGTPRAITKASDNAVVWRWDNEEAFGDNLPSEKPSGAGERFTYDLRFAGQVYDRESNTSYNYFRDYSPPLGGYQQSDPIGLAGGLNAFAYVDSNPLSYMDPYGLFGRADMPTLPQGMVDFSAGFGDVMSFGATDWLRGRTGWNDTVDKCSGAYSGGELTGVGVGLAMGGAAMARAGFRAERGAWKQGGQWFAGGRKMPHFHMGTGPGMPMHHLPYQAGNWARNFSANMIRGKAGEDLKNMATAAYGLAAAATGAMNDCTCKR